MEEELREAEKTEDKNDDGTVKRKKPERRMKFVLDTKEAEEMKRWAKSGSQKALDRRLEEDLRCNEFLIHEQT